MTYEPCVATVAAVQPDASVGSVGSHGAVDLVIGVDAGGTTTRALLADTSGRVLGTGVADGINQRSSGGAPAERLAVAVGAALAGHAPADVRASVLGVAGAGAAGHANATRDAVAAWRSVGIPTRPAVVADLLTAYAAGEPGPEGSVLVAGTGAGAAAIIDRAVVWQADGAGWLLGDVGSAVWLAREALAAVVAELDGRGPVTALTEPLLDQLGSRRSGTVQDVIAAAYAAPVAALGTLAPRVTALAEQGDHVATEIVERGVAGLLASLDAVLDRTASGRVVLAGALLTAPGPVRAGVTVGLADRGLAEPRLAHRPAAGAAWLALVEQGVADTDVHAALVGGA